MLCASSSIATQAFLCKITDNQVNRLIPGTVSVVVTEPKWDPQKGQDLTAGEVVGKDPLVTNQGKLDAWVFLKVKIPLRTIRTVDADTHKKGEAKETELFAFEAKEGWNCIETEEAADYKEYIYAYDHILKASESTGRLFEQVRMVNYLEGELNPEEILEIGIEAVAIQSSVAEDGTDPAQIYKNYMGQEHKKGGMV